ncbi:hypothetical protein GCM10017714_22020 [Curtobacterium pusillum]|uniref:DUF3060 domain-containing protein n=1 Tax=Curtobacterium pusillum TaxID=69373 RepID=A0ABX2M9J6_9MICO|nr:DUF3060 domain-containing protein [Curtobacterium pusillum]NUU14319.1 DUF3060 domain-containing protein [Curtobacterium pusillum]GLK32064.1 hypothetical protein GCM10017610_23490 [Curtobacterium pusillum]
MTSILTRSIAATGLAVIAAFCVTACSQSDADTAPEPSPTATVAQTQYNECIDGSLQIFDDSDNAKPATFGDCDGASIISSERTITLGTVPTLTVEGQKNTITVAGVKTLAVLGDGNTITYQGDAPKVDDQGEGNTIQPVG